MQSDKRTTQIDVRKFISHFGGPAEMRRLWVSQGINLTKGTQDKWVLRGAIPTSRILEAVQIARKKRIGFDLNKFVKTSREKR